MVKNGNADKNGREILRELMAQFGPVIGGRDLRKTMGYKSGEAFRQAIHRNQVAVPLFTIPHRRGRFALTSDIAVWLTAVSSRQDNGLSYKAKENERRDDDREESE